MKIRKAVIPAAGFGTRFLPATKSIPKEMFPIVNKPALQYILDEVVDSGIEEIILIIRRGKECIAVHFENYYRDVPIKYVYQNEQKGLGHAILCAKDEIGNEPFVVLLGDDVIDSRVPCIYQLIDWYNYYNSCIVGVQDVNYKDVDKYGIVSPYAKINKFVNIIDNLIEKPNIETSPSTLAIMGRYVLTPSIFKILENTKPGANDEIQLTDALNELVKREKIYSYKFSGIRYDIGNQEGLIKATIGFALEDEDLRDKLFNYLRELC